jgi:hypothetical protein
MSGMPALYDRARAHIEANGFAAATQTRIALFLGAAKSINAAILAVTEMQADVTIAYPFVHGQYFRELEFVSLLARVTRWAVEPAIYVEGTALAAPLWRAWWEIQVPLGPALDPRAGFRALALGHALLGRIRLAPLIPANASEVDPFVAGLRRIEQENGRMIQAQIRLLKDAPGGLDLAEREALAEAALALVDDAFARFLEAMAGGSIDEERA